MKNKYLILCLFCISVFSTAFAQQNMTLYQMTELAPATGLNPAVMPKSKFNFTLPLGNISIAANAPFTYKGIGGGKDMVYADDILSELNAKNKVSLNATFNLFTFGYRSKNMYFEFSINEKVDLMFGASKDPLELMLKGNGSFIDKNMNGEILLNGMYYREYAFAVSRDLGNKLQVGIRPKLLFGRVGVKSNDNRLSLFTDPEDYSLKMGANLLVQASLPGTPTFDDKGFVDGFDNFKGEDLLFGTKNMGFGVDLGASKEFTNGIRVSGSILNLGSIKFKSNTHRFSQNDSINYNGPSSSSDGWNELGDTLKSIVKFKYEAGGSFTKVLSPTFIAAGSMPISKNYRVGLTAMTEFKPDDTPWALTGTIFSEGLSRFTGGLSYTITNHSALNVGLGMGLNLGALHLYLVTDNVLASFNYKDSNYCTLQFGANFRIGRD